MTTAGQIYCSLCGLRMIGTSFIEFNGKRLPLGKGNPTAVIEQVAILLAKAPWLRLCTQTRQN